MPAGVVGKSYLTESKMKNGADPAIRAVLYCPTLPYAAFSSLPPTKKLTM
jgi:hypothetical protein